MGLTKRLYAERAPWRALLLVCLIAGCSDEKKDSGAGSTAGKVVIKGSNTIGEELGPHLIAAFKKDHPSANFDLESKATGYGLASLLAGQCDIAAASRPPIKDELDLAHSRKVELNDHVIGAYSIAVIVNEGNPLTGLKKDQVRDVFTGAVTNWKDVGGPDAPISLCVRDPISGTFLGFRELAMENKPYASGLKTFTNYNAIATAVAQDKNAIGYTSIDLAKGSGVKGLVIDGVAPETANVNQGKYPYARTLHFYTSKAKESSDALEFVRFVESKEGQQIVAQTGDVPKP